VMAAAVLATLVNIHSFSSMQFVLVLVASVFRIAG
jgi:hypothetical protein